MLIDSSFAEVFSLRSAGGRTIAEDSVVLLSVLKPSDRPLSLAPHAFHTIMSAHIDDKMPHASIGDWNWNRGDSPSAIHLRACDCDMRTFASHELSVPDISAITAYLLSAFVEDRSAYFEFADLYLSVDKK